VSFVLAITAERLNEIEFVVRYESGKFAATDGQCVVSSAAGPRAAGVSEASLLEADELQMMSRKERRARRLVVLGAEPTTTTTSTSNPTSSTETSTTTLPPTTTTMPATTTTIQTTTTTTSGPPTTLPGNGTCGDGTRNQGEECDDDNTEAGDGCDASCQLEFFFSAQDNEETSELLIRIVNPDGIPPGATLAFCKFQGEITSDTLELDTLSCSRTSGGVCTPDEHADVTLSTTTTTTTTTTSTTTTTMGNGETSTTSTTEEVP
jgi:cysteine-rich repeat protein